MNRFIPSTGERRAHVTDIYAICSIGFPQHTSAPAPAFVTSTSLPQILHLYFCPTFVIFLSFSLLSFNYTLFFPNFTSIH